MKKVFLSIIMILLLFTISSCGSKKQEENSSPVLADDEYMINDILYKIDQSESGYGIDYKIASNFRKVDSGNALNYYSQKDENGSSQFVIRIFHYKNKSIDYAIKDTTESYDSKEEIEIEGVKYTKVHFTNFNDANTYLFYHKYKKDVYVFCFTASNEEERLENIFLRQIVYK